MDVVLKDCWYVAATSEEVSRSPLGRIVCDEPLVLYRTLAGEAVVLSDLCSHRRAPLSDGRLVEDRIQCPYHGIEFNPQGRCVNVPCQDKIPSKAHIKSYPSVECDGAVWVWMGNTSKVDESLIPRAPWVGDPAWNSKTVHAYKVPASHVLTTENLLDLGHVAFLHADTIGFDASVMKEDPLVMEIEGNCVRNTRVIKNAKPSPVVQSWANFPGLIERTSISEWYPPCYTFILFRNADETQVLDQRINHYITPETAHSHHYWVRVSRNFRIDDDALTQQIYEGNERVHAQDLAIITAQQRMGEIAPDHEEVLIAQDRGVVAARRILSRLLEEEVVAERCF